MTDQNIMLATETESIKEMCNCCGGRGCIECCYKGFIDTAAAAAELTESILFAAELRILEDDLDEELRMEEAGKNAAVYA